MELFINTNLKTDELTEQTDNVFEQTIDNDESINTVDDINLPQDLNKLEEMDSKTVEELLGVMNDENEENVQVFLKFRHGLLTDNNILG